MYAESLRRISVEPQTNLNPCFVLQLRTFGVASISDESGTVAAGAATQRRTLALLALLAASGEVGCTRDRIVGLLWPESGSDRARHSLTQALYAARRALGCDDLFVAGSEIRLNPARIQSDVAAFERATAQRCHERAIELYGGPFLDGFYLGGSAEFEQWQSAQRERYAARAGDALEALATRAAADGDPRRAATMWRRLAELRPLDSRVAIELMRALAAAGDRATAIQHGRAHAARLEEQLGIEPDPAVAAYASALRGATAVPALVGAVSSPSVAASPAPGLVDVVASAADASPRGAEQGRVAVAPSSPPLATMLEPASAPAFTGTGPAPSRAPALGGAHRRGWLAALLVAALAVPLAIGIVVARMLAARAVHAGASAAPHVVVAPFRVAGASPSLAYLRDGMVELLSTRLADDSASRSVDAGGVLGAWRAAGLAAAAEVPHDTVVRIAEQLGAGRVIVGSVVGDAQRLIVHATAYSVPAGAPAGDATAQGPADSLPAIVDRLAAGLLVAQAGEESWLATHTTSSLPALRAFLVGQDAFRRTDYDAAVRAFDEALRLDSTFALAGLRLAMVADRLGDDARVRVGVSRAWAARGAMSARDRAVLLAIAGPAYPAPSTAAAQLAAWEGPVLQQPNGAEAWLAYGMRLFRDAATAGEPAPTALAATALRRSLSIDPHYGPAARILLQTSFHDPNAVRLTAEQRATATTDSLSPFAPFLRWRDAIATGDVDAARRARDAFATTGRANLRDVVMSSEYDGVAPDDGARALAALEARATTVDERVDATLARHALLMNAGRIAEARVVAARLDAILPGSHVAARLRVLDAIYGGGDERDGADAARRLAGLDADPASAMPLMPAARLADRCVLAQWRLAHGDTTDVAATTIALRGAPAPLTLPAVAPAPAACAELLEPWRAAVQHRDTRAALVHLDSLVLTPLVAGDLIAYAPLAVARLHERVGDAAGALAALGRRSYMSGWPRYLAAVRREETRLGGSVVRQAR